MSYAQLGDLQLDNLETFNALKSFRAAFQTFGSEQNGDEDHDKGLSQLYIKLAGALTELGYQSEALANLRKSIEVAEGLAREFPSVKPTQRFLGFVYGFIIGPLVGTETLNLADSMQAQIYAH